MPSDTVVFPHLDKAPIRRLRRAWCDLFGHRVDNRLFARSLSARRACRCGEQILVENGSETHVAHTLSCFLFGHAYVTVDERDGHVESVCEQCGHPLVVEASSRYAARRQFRKPVRYLCGIFGHRVHEVGERNGFVEYACDCGHSFLAGARANGKIRHPLVCVMRAHRISFVARRAGYVEFRCRGCGHPFCFPARR